MLISILLDQNQVPDKIFDWSPQPSILQQNDKFKVSDGSYDEDKMGQVDELKTNQKREEGKQVDNQGNVMKSLMNQLEIKKIHIFERPNSM